MMIIARNRKCFIVTRSLFSREISLLQLWLLVNALWTLNNNHMVVSSFQFPKLFGRGAKKVELPTLKNDVEKQKQAVLEAVNFTNNGKTATEQQQANVLKAVRALELSNPPPEDLLSNPQTAQILDGVWYLQYTSPSKVEAQELESDALWEPQELEENIETQEFQAKGSVSAAGITVDTSNRETQQIIDLSKQRVSNRVVLDWGEVYVAGKFRQSPKVFNRAVVAFDTAQIILDNGFTFDLGWAFQIVAQIKGTADNGWLETTFVDKDVRIGRGNKGTLFVLTRDPKAVQP